jgi:hypothetical protein
MRALAWQEGVLYASHRYRLLSAKAGKDRLEWNEVGRFHPAGWRRLTSASRLASRLFRDGFHALAMLPSGHFFAAVPGAIISLGPGEREFRISHKITRGTRPLHIVATPDECIFWGEYFDNAGRDEVHIYGSRDRGASWEIAYTFSKGAIRHVHNIVYDRWENCLWVATGDVGSECRILRASCDFARVESVLSGNQQARAVALVPTEDGVYFSSDTPLEKNHVYFLDRNGTLSERAVLSSSSIYGCRVGNAIFFSTMVEPSTVNLHRSATLCGSLDGERWQSLQEWEKDGWSMRLFQYGNAMLPDGSNTTNILAATTTAVRGGDQVTSLWRVAR